MLSKDYQYFVDNYRCFFDNLGVLSLYIICLCIRLSVALLSVTTDFLIDKYRYIYVLKPVLLATILKRKEKKKSDIYIFKKC